VLYTQIFPRSNNKQQQQQQQQLPIILARFAFPTRPRATINLVKFQFCIWTFKNSLGLKLELKPFLFLILKFDMSFDWYALFDEVYKLKNELFTGRFLS